MFLPTFLRSQLFVTPPYPTEDFSGKTVIVTGSNTGLGLEAARHIARLNCAKLILAVRNVSKGQQAKESIIDSEKKKEDCVEVWELDLSSNVSVKAFAKRVEGLDRLDAIVENAGIMNASFKLAEGIEQTIQVNVIGTFLLALLLLPKLRQTAQQYNVKTKLEIVTSEAHYLTKGAELDEPEVFVALNDEQRSFDGRDRYSLSKAFEVLFVRELVKHTKEKPIITLVNPGLCHSEFQRNVTSPVSIAIGWLLKALLARTTEVGSRTLVAGICAGDGSHGKYMSDGVNQEVADWVRSPRGVDSQKKVYDETIAVLESITPGISNNL